MLVIGFILLVLALLPIGLGILLWPAIVLLIVGAVLYWRPIGGRRLY